MRFKLDENLPLAASRLLREAGHDTTTVYDQGLAGSRDEQIVEACEGENRILVTLDLDFADMRAYPPRRLPGVILLRVSKQDQRAVVSVLRSLLPLVDQEQLRGRLWVVDEKSVRIRGEG